MTPTRIQLVSVALIAFAGATGAWADDAAPRTGRFRITLTERTPLSSIDELQKRYGWDALRLPREQYDYAPGDEAFDVVVPESYDGRTPHGLLVWINAGPGGGPPKAWEKPLADRRLIWIGSVDSGNQREPNVVRLSLALDAVAEMKRRYNVDDERVYVSGISGGGRMSSHVAMAFPDVFDGALPIVGVDYFRRVAVPGTKYQYNTFQRPEPELLRRALLESRWVLLTGETDYNREQTEAVYRAMVADRFRHATCLVKPGMGHTLPDAEWFAKGLDQLDEPLRQRVREAFADGEHHEQLGRFGRAVRAYESAASAGHDPLAAEAQRKAAQLRQLMRDAIAIIEQKIETGDTSGLLADIQQLKTDWTPLADDEAGRLVEKMRGR